MGAPARTCPFAESPSWRRATRSKLPSSQSPIHQRDAHTAPSSPALLYPAPGGRPGRCWGRTTPLWHVWDGQAQPDSGSEATLRFIYRRDQGHSKSCGLTACPVQGRGEGACCCPPSQLDVQKAQASHREGKARPVASPELSHPPAVARSTPSSRAALSPAHPSPIAFSGTHHWHPKNTWRNHSRGANAKEDIFCFRERRSLTAPGVSTIYTD